VQKVTAAYLRVGWGSPEGGDKVRDVATNTLSKTGQARVTRTTVFMKFLMATTGVIFVLWLIAHAYGNLKIFGGSSAFDIYAHHLRTMFEPILPYAGLLWIIRVVLIVSIFVHIYAAFYLWSRANGARPTRYVAKEAAKRTIKTKWMRWGGVAVALFILFHLFQFTWVKFNVGPDPADGSVGRLLVSSFQVWWVVLIYFLALIALGLHLWHGIWSAAQTLGWANNARSRAAWKGVAHVLSVVIIVGFLVPPFLILSGTLKG
jgi:succinate dehydrogenase / fumarate reductase cytochrome b subunit